MGELVLTTYDWVPEMPRGFVRDLRIRWALEEAGLPYRVVTTPFRNKTSEHFAHQPFGQVPWLTDGDLSIFESGAILLHLGSRSDKLLPVDARRRNEAIEWIFAALNSVEMATQPWALLQWMGEKKDSTALKFFDDWVRVHRLKHLETVLAERDWLAARVAGERAAASTTARQNRPGSSTDTRWSAGESAQPSFLASRTTFADSSCASLGTQAYRSCQTC